MRGPKWAVSSVVAISLIAIPGSAHGATTIGSDLTRDATVGLLCGGTERCTVVQRTLPDRQLTAPTDGVIVRWRIKVGMFSVLQTVTLRVVRRSGTAATGIASSDPENVPSAPGVHSFDAQLPIRAGDRIGIDCCQQGIGEGGFFAVSPDALYDFWDDSLENGETREPTGNFPYELLVNADVEPDCDHDGLGDETQDSDLASCNVNCQESTVSSTTGTEGDDNLVGTINTDAIFGLGGNDELDGVRGNDCLDAGEGDDRANGGGGDDLVKGGDGRDKVRGVGGKDRLKGQGGVDRVNGAEGRDKLSGGRGNDKLDGGAAKDAFKGNAGNDDLNAVDAKRDRVNCGGGDDKAVVDPIDRVSANCETVREVDRD